MPISPLRQIEIEAYGSLVENKLKKVQSLWRTRRVFTNEQTGWKLSTSRMLARIVSFKTRVNLYRVLSETPRGVTNVAGYRGTGQKPIVRFVNSNWIGESNVSKITRITARKGTQTIVLTPNSIDVLGSGAYEPALLAIVKNGWADKSLLRASPVYKKIDGAFYINKSLLLEDMRYELHKLPMAKTITYAPGLFPALVLKLKNPAWTYQFFKNGTVLFTGVKDPKDIDKPRQLFKQFFSEHGLFAPLAINLTSQTLIRPPKTNTSAKKKKLAERYPSAGTWNALKPPIPGFYIRPGTNGQPRMYPYRILKKNPETGHVFNMGPLNLTSAAPKVYEAFKKIGQPIPNSTRQVFNSLGLTLGSPKKKTEGTSRRAPGWNATKNGFYVRPGPGQQPYWYAIPKGLATGRKTVIEAYKKAGRNIPRAVRNIFKIGNNVTINATPEHTVTMGLNGILRINNRQVTRLTKPQLIAIARNMNIPQVNASMAPDRIIGFIRRKAGVKAPSRNFNVEVNGVKYTFLPEGRVQKTVGTKRTTRNWKTLPNKNKIAKAFLPAHLHAEWNAFSAKNKYNALLAHKTIPSNSNENFVKELENLMNVPG
jgi:hypothetical protein